MKLAHSDARKVLGVSIATSLNDISKNGSTVDVEVPAEQNAYQEELTDAVDDVQYLDEQVQDDEIVAEELAEHEAR